MASDEVITLEGVVKEVLYSGMYRVKIKNSDHEIMAYLKGKMKLFNIRIVAGDAVTLEVSPYDLSKGRIIYRNK